MKTVLKSVLFATTVLAAVTTSTPASARTQTAILGSPASPSDSGCFTQHFGSIIKNSAGACSGARTWRMPLVVDSSGYRTVKVTAIAVTSTMDVSCQPHGMGRDGAWYPQPAKTLDMLNTFQDITFAGVYSPDWGAPFIECTLDHEGRITMLSY